MGGIGSGDLIGFPDIHFVAARAVAAGTSIGIVGRSTPASDVSLKTEW